MELFREIDQHLQRVYINVDVKDIDSQLGDLKLAPGNKQAAADYDNQIKKTGEKRIPGVIAAHHFIGVGFGCQEFLIAPAKFFSLRFFVGEGFDDADSRQAVLKAGVDFGYFYPVIREDGSHFQIPVNAVNDHDQGHQE